MRGDAASAERSSIAGEFSASNPSKFEPLPESKPLIRIELARPALDFSAEARGKSRTTGA